MKIIDRYILKELIPPFFIGLLLFTFVLLINRIFKLTDLIVNKGVPLGTVARLFAYIMPSFMTLTIPMAVLLAALVAFGRLSTDSEMIALKATGFSFYRLMAPVMALAIAACAVTAYFSLYLGPEKARTFKRDLFILAKTRSVINIEEEVFNDSLKNLVFYTQKTPSPNEMQGVFISDERNPAEPYVIIAQKGVLDVDPATGVAYLDLTNGSIHKKGTKAEGYQKITFDTNNLSINLYDKLFNEDELKKPNRELPLGELWAKADEVKAAGGNYYPVLTEYYRRFSIPVACIIFGLVGPPLGLYSRRSGRSAGMSMALAVFAVYYLLMKGGENIASNGAVPPALAAVIPNVVIGAFGLYVLVTTARETAFNPAERVSDLYTRSVRGGKAKRLKKGRRDGF